MGAGGLAVLAALPEREAREIGARIAESANAFPGFSADQQPGRIKRARALGYAYIESPVVPDVAAIACAVRDPFGNPIAAITNAAIRKRFEGEGLNQAVAAIRNAVDRIERDLKRSDNRVPV